MDDPQLDAEAHHTALQGLRRVNRWSRTAATLWDAIRPIAERNGGGELRVLDIGCGGGDLVCDLAERADQAGRPMTFDGCDLSARAVEFAEVRAQQRGCCDSLFFRLDAIGQPLPTHYDVLICSLFLHHLADEDARRLLKKMSEAAQVGVIVSDLRRSRVGYVLAWTACRLLSRSPVVHTDGPLSVRAAFTMEEARELATSAGLHECQIQRRWPQRFLLTWERP